MPRRSSSVVGREFGNGVRDAIKQTHMTHRQIAENLDWDESKLSDMVRGKGGVSEAEVLQLLAFCRVPPAETRHLITLYRETRENGYLQTPAEGWPDKMRVLIEQERLANVITVWSMNLIPGRLQTSDYMRAVVAGGVRDDSVDYEKVITTRLARRELFHWSREFVFFVHEQALRLPVGSPDVMKDQLLHLLGMEQRSYITIRVVPTAMGAHAGLSGSFMQLRYEKFEPVVFIESQTSGLFLEDKASLAIYAKALKLLDRQAMDAVQSKELITSILN
ncbi:helix-turn-helix transcriptional regulator [Lentzea sp. BCCO 10_0856]|uniref:Helix-turn-helix transcriptional regulator n=1 Tax=Lentzea miocenica TaxID=3095431 RepID=A0ABU4T0C6_9PSEU|nr:helix-turn-helix transcriptional regulator [Lentzea sp. BCCO 10_0856]MDX8031604.1 helix-turn-helix transcriptional regulator [Lentzea sp. BCCO 10_0856]